MIENKNKETKKTPLKKKKKKLKGSNKPKNNLWLIL